MGTRAHQLGLLLGRDAERSLARDDSWRSGCRHVPPWLPRSGPGHCRPLPPIPPHRANPAPAGPWGHCPPRPSPAPSPPAASPSLLPAPPAAPCRRHRVPLGTFPAHHHRRHHPFLAHRSCPAPPPPQPPMSLGPPAQRPTGQLGPGHQPSSLRTRVRHEPCAMSVPALGRSGQPSPPRCHARGTSSPRGSVCIPLRVPTGAASQGLLCPAPASRYS